MINAELTLILLNKSASLIQEKNDAAIEFYFTSIRRGSFVFT